MQSLTTHLVPIEEVNSDWPAPDLNPTTMRFSRRCGDAFRGQEYAASLEIPGPQSSSWAGPFFFAVVTVSLLATLVAVS